MYSREHAFASFYGDDLPHSSTSIVDKFSHWADQLHGQHGRGALKMRLDALLLAQNIHHGEAEDQPSIVTGRTDVSISMPRMSWDRFLTLQMARPDAMPEHDVISLQMITVEEAQRLYDL